MERMADDLDVAALVAGALRDDEEAARELVRRLYPFVAKMVRSHRPKRAAEEVVGFVSRRRRV